MKRPSVMTRRTDGLRALLLGAVLLACDGCGLKGDLYEPVAEPDSATTGQSAPEEKDERRPAGSGP